MNKYFFSDLVEKVKLTYRLLKDSRVSPWYKLIPICCLIYFIVPMDLLIGPIDDAILMYLGMDVFIEMCPKDIVAEHLADIRGQSVPSSAAPDEDVIDAEFKDKD
jgi:uncharacterized membrane protein YkvA (DUF1232 family)